MLKTIAGTVLLVLIAGQVAFLHAQPEGQTRSVPVNSLVQRHTEPLTDEVAPESSGAGSLSPVGTAPQIQQHHLGTSRGDANYDESADLNADGQIDAIDVALLTLDIEPGDLAADEPFVAEILLSSTLITEGEPTIELSIGLAGSSIQPLSYSLNLTSFGDGTESLVWSLCGDINGEAARSTELPYSAFRSGQGRAHLTTLSTSKRPTDPSMLARLAIGSEDLIGKTFVISIEPTSVLVDHEARVIPIQPVSLEIVVRQRDGDINGDSSIDFIDLTELLGGFGSTRTSFDLDASGSVDVADLQIVLENLGQSSFELLTTNTSSFAPLASNGPNTIATGDSLSLAGGASLDSGFSGGALNPQDGVLNAGDGTLPDDIFRGGGTFPRRDGQAADTIAPRIISVSPPPTEWIVNNLGLNQVVIGFDESVIVPASAVHAWTAMGGAITSISILQLSPSSIEVTFPSPVLNDRLTVVIDYSITDLAGNELDGEIALPSAPTLPSGDGIKGGQAAFRFSILQGDVNRDGSTDATDSQLLAAALGTGIGDLGYSVLADLNNDGFINVLDVNIHKTALGQSLQVFDGVDPTLLSRSPDINETVMLNGLSAATVVFTEPIRSASIFPTSLYAVLPDGSLQPGSAVTPSSGNTVATFVFNPPLPTSASYSFRLNRTITDVSGLFLPLSEQLNWLATIDPAPPIKATNTAIIIGRVVDAVTGVPIQDAIITGNFFPKLNGEPPLPPIAMTGLDGEFVYESVPFVGMAEFLIQIRKDGFAENLRRVEIMAGRCNRINESVLNAVTPPVMVME